MDEGRENDLPVCDINHEDGIQQQNINISDVIEVIQTTDPSYEAAVQNCDVEMYSGGGPLPGPSQGMPQPQTMSQPRRRGAPYVRIVEQPASKSLRFRYECEGRSAGSIPGATSTPENKTYPTIEIVGYKGRAVVVVSCVTKDHPYKTHPHNLVGKDGCKKGVCTVEINSESMSVSFSNLGIQCVKKKDIEDALKVREEIRVDPFKNGFAHRSQPATIDLNAVRLCFQVFLEGAEKGKFTQPMAPVVSDIIFDKKAMSDLIICKMSHCSASVAGGQEIILLCEKVAKEDISIRFYEEINGQIVWEALGDFQHANVHKQVAIAFKTPAYRSITVEHSVSVSIQLKRPSDGALSEPLPFELLPLDSDPVEYKRKRQKLATDQYSHLRNLRPPIPDIAIVEPYPQPPPIQNIDPQQAAYNFAMSPEQNIKLEPREQTPSPYGGNYNAFGFYRNIQSSPSPQPQPTPSPPSNFAVGGTWTGSNIPNVVPVQPLVHQALNFEGIPNSMNIQSAPPQGATLGTSDANTLNNLLLDMDSQQFTQLSGDMSGLSSLLEVFQSNADDGNNERVMTDSFSKLFS